MTVKEFALCACSPEKITIMIGADEFEIISETTGDINKLMLTLVADYVVEDFKANKPDGYCVWVLERPVKAGEL